MSRVLIGLCLLMASGAGARAAEPTKAATPEKGAGENVQILKGLTEQQLDHAMGLIRGGLGTHCDFCHVSGAGGQWNFASDDKEAKRTARRMIQMVLDVNKAFFDGEPRVTCFTCHQGATKPVGLLPLPQAVPPFPTVAPPPVTAGMPSADEILDRYTQALGGKPALDGLTSRVMRGSLVPRVGPELPLEEVFAAPSGYLSTVTRPQGVTSRGFDGQAGWARGPRGVQEVTGAGLEDLARAADFFRDIRLRERFPDLVVTGRETIAGREAFVLQAQGGAGRIERFFFDVESGLLVRRARLTKTPLGYAPEETAFEDYRDVSGVRLPFTVTSSGIDPWVGQQRRYTEIQINVPVDRTRFAKPAEPPLSAGTKEGAPR